MFERKWLLAVVIVPVILAGGYKVHLDLEKEKDRVALKAENDRLSAELVKKREAAEEIKRKKDWPLPAPPVRPPVATRRPPVPQLPPMIRVPGKGPHDYTPESF